MLVEDDVSRFLVQMLKEARDRLAQVNDLAMLEKARLYYFGKKDGQLVALLKDMRSYDVKARQLLNQTKTELLQLFVNKRAALEEKALQDKLRQQSIDVSLLGRDTEVGRWHLITQQYRRLNRILAHLGFTIFEGPEIEDEFHNFTALNMPKHHPARSVHDTFYLNARPTVKQTPYLLRTHTSTIQIRFMKDNPPPFRVASIGRVYRRDSDLTHTPMFHQLEGLWIDEKVSFADLKGLLQVLLQSFFEWKKLDVRIRPTYFPFTEPSAEVDIQCQKCVGKSCRLCGYSGWIEVLGCGMVHPNVLDKMEIDKEKYTGVAFGIGIERLALLHHGLDDLRHLFENDWRFLGQFT